MFKCDDCWCEHYDKNRGNCDKCVKKKAEKSSSVLKVLLEKRAVQQMQLNDKKEIKGQIR